MSFEHPQSKNDERADAVMRKIRNGESASVPAAIRQILRNELITHEPDVKRIMGEIASILRQRQLDDGVDEIDADEIHRELLEEKMLEGAREAEFQRGGDPKD